MARVGFGYRNITGAWNRPNNTVGPYCTPDVWYYDTVNENVWLCWTSAGNQPDPPWYPVSSGYPFEYQAYATWPEKALCAGYRSGSGKGSPFFKDVGPPRLSITIQ